MPAMIASWNKKGKRTVVMMLLLLLPLSYFSLYKPLKSELDQAILDNHRLVTEAKAQTLSQFVQRSREGAEGLSSRSVIRDLLMTYQSGETTWEALQDFTSPRYMDGVNALDQVAYAGRWVNGEALVESTPGVWSTLDHQSFEELEALFSIGTETQVFLAASHGWLGVYSPVLHQGSLLGYDLVLFDMNQVLQEMASETLSVELLQQGSLGQGVWLQQGAVIAQHRVPALEGVVLQTQGDAAQLFRNIDRINRQNIIVFLAGFFAVITLIYMVLARDATKVMHQLQQAKEEADAANEAKSRYLAHMNHELRTPLNGFMGFLHLLGDTPLDQAQQEYMGHLKQISNHLLSIISNVLDHATIEAGTIRLNNQLFNLEKEVGIALAPLRSLAREKNIDLDIDLDSSLPGQLVGDPDRLRQIILNLGGNAVKYTDQGRVSIAISCAETKGDKHWLKLLVEDTGMGMTQETMAKLFRPFYQADDGSVRQSRGTGLGLAITRELVNQMEGEIRVESTLGKGTRMEVDLLLGRVLE